MSRLATVKRLPTLRIHQNYLPWKLLVLSSLMGVTVHRSIWRHLPLQDKKNTPKQQESSQTNRSRKRSKQDPLEYARNIVNRYKVRGNVLPCRWLDRQNDPVREQEFKDALKLTRWKLALKGNRTGYGVCSDEVRDFLDQEMPGWRQERHASTS